MMRPLAACCAPVLFFLSGPAAGQFVADPPADLAIAYSHRAIPTSSRTRPLAVTGDGRFAAYAVRVPTVDSAGGGSSFAPGGTPFSVVGISLELVDLQSRRATPICPAAGSSWNPSWSPDGTRLAFYSDRDGASRLWLFDRRSQSCRRVSGLTVKALPWPTEHARWSADGSHIYFPVWPTAGPGSLAAVTAAGSVVDDAPRPGGRGVSVYRHDPALSGAPGRPASIPEDFEARCGSASEASSSLAMVPSEGGEARLVVDGEAARAPGRPDRHYPTPHFRTSASGRWLSYFAAPCRRPGGGPHDATTSLFAARAEGGTPLLVSDGLRTAFGGMEFDLDYRWSPVADELVYIRDRSLWRVTFGAAGPSSSQRLAPELGPLSEAIHWYSRNGAYVLVGTDPVATGRANEVWAFDIGLALVPVAGGTPIRLPLDRARWAVRGVVSQDERSFWQPAATSLCILALDKATGENVMLTFDWRRGEMTESWRGRGRFDALTPAGSGLIGVYEDFGTPPDLVAMQADMRRRTRLTRVEPRLAEGAAGSVELFETVVPQHDGGLRTVRSAVLLPPGARRGDRLPAIVWLYPGADLTGRLNQFGAPAVGDPAYIFTSRGYAVLLTHVAIGPGEQPGHVIDEIMDALMPQVQHAADLGYVDINRLAIRGNSFGGFATAAVVARTNLFRAAIPSSGRYDMIGGYAQPGYFAGTVNDPTGWFETSQPRLGAPLWTDRARYMENSPYFLADRIRTPMLILQGSDDPVGAREAGKLFVALRRLDRPVELAMYDGGGHAPSAWVTPQAIDQAARQLEFLRRHIGEGWRRDRRER